MPTFATLTKIFKDSNYIKTSSKTIKKGKSRREVGIFLF